MKHQNSIIEEYLQAFVNIEPNNRIKLLLIAKFAYNNAKNASTGHIFFELNCGYYPTVFFEENIDPCSPSKITNELSAKLQKLMTV